MNDYLGLSDIEYELMTFFWNQEKPVPFGEILRFCNEEKGWNWAKTTAHTYVTRLLKKNLLGVNNTKGIRRTYFAKVSQEALAHDSVQEIVNTSYAGSFKNLLLSLVPDKPLSREDAEELHELLDQLIDTEDSAKS